MEALVFSVVEKNIECDATQIVGDNDYQASFLLDDEWDDKEVICRVIWNNKTSLDIALEDYSCIIPAYFVKTGELSVGVYVEGDENLATTPWKLGVLKSVKESVYGTAVPHKEVWDKINEKVADMVTNSEFDSKLNDYLAENDKLAGKHIVCMGDSLVYGYGWEGGYANCIKEKHPDVTIDNIAVSGALMIHGGILSQIADYNTSGGKEPDIVLFDGGGNDFLGRVTLGEVDMTTSAVTGGATTTCDALELLIFNVKKTYPCAKLMYVSTPPMVKSSTDTGIPSPAVQREYLDAIEKVLLKWGIPMADLYRNGNISSAIPTQLQAFFLDDCIHLNEAGYRHVAPVIEDALNKLF